MSTTKKKSFLATLAKSIEQEKEIYKLTLCEQWLIGLKSHNPDSFNKLYGSEILQEDLENEPSLYLELPKKYQLTIGEQKQIDKNVDSQAEYIAFHNAVFSRFEREKQAIKDDESLTEEKKKQKLKEYDDERPSPTVIGNDASYWHLLNEKEIEMVKNVYRMTSSSLADRTGLVNLIIKRYIQAWNMTDTESLSPDLFESLAQFAENEQTGWVNEESNEEVSDIDKELDKEKLSTPKTTAKSS